MTERLNGLSFTNEQNKCLWARYRVPPTTSSRVYQAPIMEWEPIMCPKSALRSSNPLPFTAHHHGLPVPVFLLIPIVRHTGRRVRDEHFLVLQPIRGLLRRLNERKPVRGMRAREWGGGGSAVCVYDTGNNHCDPGLVGGRSWSSTAVHFMWRRWWTVDGWQYNILL